MVSNTVFHQLEASLNVHDHLLQDIRTSITLPRVHCAHVLSGEISNATSPTLMLFCSLNHLRLGLKLGIHSRNQRCQKCLINSCTRRQCFFGLYAISSGTSGANLPQLFTHVSNDLALVVYHLLDQLIGLEFIRASAPVRLSLILHV